jgi:hypothetical protein
MGALKGRFQCLRGLHVNINSPNDHIRACHWITVAIILHNLIIDVEGTASGHYFQPEHPGAHEMADTGDHEEENEEEEEADEGEVKRRQLTAELLAFRETRGIPF